MLRFLACLPLLLLASCVTESAPVAYKPAGQIKPVQITGKHDYLAGGTGTLYIFIDGETVIEHHLPVAGDNPQIAHGTWNGKPVRAVFPQITTYYRVYPAVTVYIDGELAAVLSM